MLRFICIGLKRESLSKVENVTPNQLQSFQSYPGTYIMFPTKSFSISSEAVGTFQATYSIFRHVFSQMGACMLVSSLLEELQAYFLYINFRLQVPYHHVLKRLKKPPDPFSGHFRSFFPWAENIGKMQNFSLIFAI